MPPSEPTSQYPRAAGATGKLCGFPVPPKKFVPCATLAVSVQVPKNTKVTVCPSGPTTQMPGESEVRKVKPSPLVPTEAWKLPNSTALPGKLVTAGDVGVARPTLNDWVVPVPGPYCGVAETTAVTEHVPTPT